ncbi:50S ribosomal protein L21 [bacterium]|nr:50S ribosomal protein L21 [bacterium]
MYAIIATGGKQYKVSEGDTIHIEKIDGEPGTAVKFDSVLFINDGKKAITDAEQLAKASVEGEILDQYRDKKVIVFKFRRRKRYHRTRGHRQYLTKVRITGINAAAKA